MRDRGAARVVLAAPVVASSVAVELWREFDDVVAVELPSEFYAVGYWYQRFPQISDREVAEVLHRARYRRQQAGAKQPRRDGEGLGAGAEDPPDIPDEILSHPDRSIGY